MDKKLFWIIFKLSGHFPTIDRLLVFFSKKARYIFAIIGIFMWMRRKEYKQTLSNLTLSTILALIINRLCKLFFFKPRPFMKQRVGILIPAKNNSTFPSKHTLLAVVFSTSVWLQQKVIGYFMLILSLFTGFSRIWLGHHYPSDIIGSTLLGSLIAYIINKTSQIFKINIFS